ncbi:TetR family transcriptional regulator [Streptomyces sp. Ag109_O5-1]|uniref:TetR/AcrR family transcriptional regulator n=1 Tax=Streptomyces sp. Ag109_O5-1 TaxID=1938851 RepID=UPI000F97C152|nr:TetR/AcrR family transcriptional regulator [Streptomyces sp. Ag109_O5-1]RPE39163.1 TetR family transcriptional regulator [Streptomyces sp. Ag109_O5-1]
MPELTDAELELLPLVEGMSAARRKLYVTALRLFAEHGYHAISVRDITDALGQRSGALYAHVASKQELLYQLMRIGVSEHRDRLRAAVLDAGSEPADQLRALVRSHVLVHLAYPDLARLVSREARSLDDAQREGAQAVIHETERTLLDVIERGQRLGSFRADTDPLLAGAAIGGMGVRVPEWWTPAVPRTPEQIADTYAEFALRLFR